MLHLKYSRRPVYSPKFDIEFGCTGVYFMDLLHWCRRGDLAIIQVIKAGKYFATYWDDVSKSAKDLISKLLEVNPEVRYSARQVLSPVDLR